MMNNSQTEISIFTKDNNILSEFISKNYAEVSDVISASSANSIYPFKVNYISRNSSLTFCHVPIVKSWIFKKDSSFVFFIMVKYNSGLVDSISKVFGQQEVESDIQIGNSLSSTTYIWKKEVKIYLSQYINIWDFPEFNNCSLILFGNMNYKDIMHSG